MRIENNTKNPCSYFVYNDTDQIQKFALTSGDLDKGQAFDYSPPTNANGWYVVHIWRNKGGAGGIVGAASGEADCQFNWTSSGSGNRQSWELQVS